MAYEEGFWGSNLKTHVFYTGFELRTLENPKKHFSYAQISLRGGWVKTDFSKKKIHQFTLNPKKNFSLTSREEKNRKIFIFGRWIARKIDFFDHDSILRPRFLGILTDFFFWILKICRLKFFFGKTSREEKNQNIISRKYFF